SRRPRAGHPARSTGLATPEGVRFWQIRQVLSSASAGGLYGFFPVRQSNGPALSSVEGERIHSSPDLSFPDFLQTQNNTTPLSCGGDDTAGCHFAGPGAAPSRDGAAAHHAGGAL